MYCKPITYTFSHLISGYFTLFPSSVIQSRAGPWAACSYPAILTEEFSDRGRSQLWIETSRKGGFVSKNSFLSHCQSGANKENCQNGNLRGEIYTTRNMYARQDSCSVYFEDIKFFFVRNTNESFLALA